MKKGVIIGILLVSVLLVSGGCGEVTSEETIKEPVIEDLIECVEEQRGVEECPKEDSPVCANVQVICATTPCNPKQETYSNSCEACKSVHTLSYTSGKCFDEDIPVDKKEEKGEVIEVINKFEMSEALNIAERDCSTGIVETHEAFYNDATKTWWFNFKPNEPNKLCNPACVVGEETKTAEINWRCTGLIQ